MTWWDLGLESKDKWWWATRRPPQWDSCSLCELLPFNLQYPEDDLCTLEFIQRYYNTQMNIAVHCCNLQPSHLACIKHICLFTWHSSLLASYALLDFVLLLLTFPNVRGIIWFLIDSVSNVWMSTMVEWSLLSSLNMFNPNSAAKHSIFLLI